MSCSYLLAAASLCISPPVFAFAAQEVAPAGAEQVRLEQQPFSPSLHLEGRQFRRLTGPKLAKAISGKTICFGRCSDIAGNVTVYYRDGRYAEFGDRWEGYGTYKISKNVVITNLEGHITRRAFYRSCDGLLAQAVVNRRGEIVAGEVVVEDFPSK